MSITLSCVLCWVIARRTKQATHSIHSRPTREVFHDGPSPRAWPFELSGDEHAFSGSSLAPPGPHHASRTATAAYDRAGLATSAPPIHFRTQVLTAEGAGHTAGVLVFYSSSSHAVL